MGRAAQPGRGDRRHRHGPPHHPRGSCAGAGPLADGGQLRLPAWQFHADTPRGRLEGIDVVARAHAGGPVTLSQWMTRPNPALAGRSPAEALADGEVDAVASAAREGV
ncbi:MAG: hypothetical protein BRC31_08020 [Actinobacteria bacterium QS_5_72_10]|nr:MAG: hypothetical protein BRC31_08020 [Actinobacteria bacterium QS_5_72_10]